MSEVRTQSRPCAEAAFEVAKADDTLDKWIKDFSSMETAFEDEKVLNLVETPSISQIEKTIAQLTELKQVLQGVNQ